MKCGRFTARGEVGIAPASYSVLALVVVGVLSCRVAAAEPSSKKGGAEVYRTRCAHCHGESGKTDTSVGRVFKVAPLVGDPRLARMTPAEIAQLNLSDPKHRAVVDLDEDDVKAAAVFVKRLAARR
jgi:cytochrome c